MKAKDLAKILLITPDAEVVHYQYTGGDTPLLEVNTVIHETAGEFSRSVDGGHFINKEGVVENDILILTFDPNESRKCIYDVCHHGRCNEDVIHGFDFCKDHLNKKCWKIDCDLQAVGDCHKYNGSFVCGTPMCPTHKHQEHN